MNWKIRSADTFNTNDKVRLEKANEERLLEILPVSLSLLSGLRIFFPILVFFSNQRFIARIRRSFDVRNSIIVIPNRVADFGF